MLRRFFLALAVVIAVSAVGQDFKLHQIRWVALSHDMFKQHGFKMGDVIIVESESTPAINGEWVVKDKMGPRLRKRIDFLTPRGDKYNFRNGAVTIRKKNADRAQK